MADEKTTGGEKTFTQAELDAQISQRLDRERAKFSDYEVLKEKAAKYDEAEEKNKSELQKAREEAADYKAKYEAREKAIAATQARAEVASETGVPANLLVGDTKADCKAYADKLIQWRDGAPPMPNHGVDSQLGGKSGNGGAAKDAALSALRDSLFPKN